MSHPLDRRLGVRTSPLPAAFARLGARKADASNTGHVGTEPSVLRAALHDLPQLEGASFFDLGSGSGRALFVAADQGFRHVVGIEQSPLLHRAARRNLRRWRRPAAASPVSLRLGDAAAPDLPLGRDLVIYLYNPFGGASVALLVERLEAHGRAEPARRLFVVYNNPVHSAAFDRSAGFSRYHLERYALAPEERAASLWADHDHDNVAIWQSRGPNSAPPRETVGRRIQVTWNGEVGEILD